MLPVVNLDNESYEEIFDKARNMIAGIYPEWTDYNEHDPGITFLQLLSWMKEMQQFHLDQIGQEHLKMYLKMLGMEPRRKVSASTLVKVDNFEDGFLLPKGTRLLAGNIPFETEKEERIEKVKLLECVCIAGEEQNRIGNDILELNNKMRCFPFGEEPKAGNLFLLKFDRALKGGRRHTIYFDLFDGYPVSRNPIDKNFCPLARIEVEYYGEAGFTRCEAVQDYTDQLLHSGILEYQLPSAMVPMEDGTFGIRIRLVSCEYDLPPILQSIQFNVIPVRQEETLADFEDVSLPVEANGRCTFDSSRRIFIDGMAEVYQKTDKGFVQLPKENVQAVRTGNRLQLVITPKEENSSLSEITFRIIGYDDTFHRVYKYEMDGFPDQELNLDDDKLLYECFELMAENYMEPGVWEEWEKKENFHCSTPKDRHYRLDEEQGIVTFGDCEQGLAPEGQLKIVRYVRTLGSRGNVRRGQIRSFENTDIHAAANNQEDVSNGGDKEGIEACFTRFRQEFQKIERAVTARDYETLVLRTPGLRIQRVKAIPMELMKKNDGSFLDNCVSIVVQPFSYHKQEKLSSAYINNISRMLEERRLIGTKVQLLSPEYIEASVFVDIIVKPHYPAAQDMIEKMVKDYFENTIADFGATLEESGLYGMLDGLKCVLEVRNLAIHAQGKGVRRGMNGKIKLPVNGLVYLKQADYIITAGAT